MRELVRGGVGAKDRRPETGAAAASGATGAERPPEGAPRRVLMVLYHFPPIGGVAMSRNVRNIEHLPRFGWTPVVIAPRDPAEPVDRDAVRLIAPGTVVLRARNPGPRALEPVVSRVRSLGVQSIQGATRALRTRPDVSASGGPPVAQRGSRLGVVRRLVFFPDDEIGWLPFAVIRALREHRARPVDAIYSTASPITAHLVAGIVSELTGRPWVAEFRDPWMGNPVAGRLPWLHRRLQVKLERWIVQRASRLVFLSASTRRTYERRYPGAGPMVTIPNGHDPSEAAPAAARRGHDDRVRLVWTGSLYRPAELQLLLDGIDATVERRPELVGRLQVTFYGSVSSECEAVAERASAPVRSMLSFAGFVPRAAALAAVRDADAALVMLGGGPGMDQFVPGKLFDYIGQSVQILAVVPPGDARDILMELNWGLIADPEPAAIAAAIERLADAPVPAGPADPNGRYDRVMLAGRLGTVLADAAGIPAPSPARAVA